MGFKQLDSTLFDSAAAERFTQEVIRRAGLSASNIKEFLAKVLELSEGNPGAILSMLQMAKSPKYRAEEHIKITPLYIDFRMNWSSFAGKADFRCGTNPSTTRP